MASESKKLLEAALKLPRKSREMIAEKLLESLEEDDGLNAAIDQAEDRWKAFKAGKIKAIPIEAVFPNFAAKRQ